MPINRRLHAEDILVSGAFAFFCFMLLFRLTYSPLWGDEWNEFFFSQERLWNGDLYRRIITTFQPPLYNFLMHFWLKASTSHLWFRLFNVFPGFLSGIFYYKTMRQLYNKKIAAICLIVLGACHQWIYCVQECSEYTLMLTFLFGAIYFLLKTVNKYKTGDLLGMLFCCVGAMYSQYGATFVILPLLLYFFINAVQKRREIPVAKVGIMYLLCLAIFAVPLYLAFLQKQMQANKIGSDMRPLGAYAARDFLTTAGKLFGYIFHQLGGTTQMG